MNTLDNKKRMLEALEMHKGIVSSAAKSAGLSRGVHYLWMQEDADYKKAVEDMADIALDFVESKLMERIEGVEVEKGSEIYATPPDTTAIIFYLKTKGKKRGYIERKEITGADGQDLLTEIKINIVNPINKSE